MLPKGLSLFTQISGISGGIITEWRKNRELGTGSLELGTRRPGLSPHLLNHWYYLNVKGNFVLMS
jgi:hypothetical protein